MPAVNGVGEPCAGEPHARFEEAGTGNGADLAKDTGVAQPAGKPAATKAPGPKASEPPRQSPTLQQISLDAAEFEMVGRGYARDVADHAALAVMC
jgi:hypothetical protein